MGQDKSRLQWQGQSLLERAVNLLRPHCKEVLISANTGEKQLHGQWVIADKLPPRGPISGIYSALIESHTQMSIIIPCDMPLLSPELIAHLIEMALPGRVCLPGLHGESLPLPAIMPTTLAPAIYGQILNGEYKLISIFLHHVPVLIPCEAFDAGEFRNINSPEDFDQLLDD